MFLNAARNVFKIAQCHKNQLSHSPTLSFWLSNTDHNACSKCKNKNILFNVAKALVFCIPFIIVVQLLIIPHISWYFSHLQCYYMGFLLNINDKSGKLTFYILYGNSFSKRLSNLVGSKTRATTRVQISKTCYFPALYINKSGWLSR